MPRELLVGIDGSDPSRAALAWAGAVARAFDAKVVLASAWQYPSTAVFPTAKADLQGPDQVDKQVQRTLEELAAEVLPEDVQTEVEVLRGPAANALVHLAARRSPIALVLGSRGLGAFEGMVLGSVSKHCLDHSSVPVVVLPHGWDEATPLRSLVVGVDGSPGAKAALAWATELAAASGAVVLVASVLPYDQSELQDEVYRSLVIVAESDLERWCEPLRAAQVEHRPLLVKGADPREALVDLAEEEDADLLVVGARGSGPLSRLLLGSVANEVTRRSTRPFAVVPLDR